MAATRLTSQSSREASCYARRSCRAKVSCASPAFSDTIFVAKVAHGRVEQLLLTIKRAEVNVAQVLNCPVILQGAMQRDGGHRVDVTVVEGGEFPFPLFSRNNVFPAWRYSCSHCLSRSSCYTRRSCCAEMSCFPRIQRFIHYFLLKLLIDSCTCSTWQCSGSKSKTP